MDKDARAALDAHYLNVTREVENSESATREADRANSAVLEAQKAARSVFNAILKNHSYYVNPNDVTDIGGKFDQVLLTALRARHAASNAIASALHANIPEAENAARAALEAQKAARIASEAENAARAALEAALEANNPEVADHAASNALNAALHARHVASDAFKAAIEAGHAVRADLEAARAARAILEAAFKADHAASNAPGTENTR